VGPTEKQEAMTPDRAQAYGRVVRTVGEIGPSKLLPVERDRIRAAADLLLFARNVSGDDEARDALLDVDDLCRHLADSGRWEPTTADRLAHDLFACAPWPEPAELAA
jgi:hypothetical protein